MSDVWAVVFTFTDRAEAQQFADQHGEEVIPWKE